MAGASLYVNSRSYDCKISVDNIVIQGGPFSYTIFIPMTIEFVPDQKIELISTIGELKGTEKNIQISECFHLLSHKIYNRTTYSMTYRFLITDVTLEQIEKYRRGNLPLNLTFSLQLGFLHNLQIVEEPGKVITKSVITETYTAQGHIQFEIEQSYWINKILSAIQYPSFKLIELPLFNKIVPNEYSLSLNELDEANKYFLNGDYDKSVAHCRSAIEPFKKRLPELKEFVKSKSEFDWANNVLSATEEWLDKVIKSTSSFTSKSHHVPSIGHFGRSDAEIIMMITTGIIAYIGKLQFKPA